MKRTFYTEAAYVIGLITLALGTAFMERADFGMSMVVAPAYLIYLKVSGSLRWFSFGMAEYCFQAFLIIVLTIVLRRFKRKYLFSFITALIYGSILDIMMNAVKLVPGNEILQRAVFYGAGLVMCAIGVSLLFHTYISPEAYELFVKEISDQFDLDISKTKTVYDCCSCIVAVVMSFLFIGFWHFEGVKMGTVLCALINGWMIGQCSNCFEKHFDFVDAFGFRKQFD